jgi:hypothetical protein
MVNTEVATMLLYFPKSERMDMISRDTLVTKAPTRKGLISGKVRVFDE